MTEPEDAAPAEPDPRRETARRLLQAHGDPVRRYCRAMLGDEGAERILPIIFGHAEELAEPSEAEAPDGSTARLTLLALTRNRCIERSRSGGKPPAGEGLEDEEAGAVAALAQLRPVGRGLLLLRWLAGLRWSELERVCGQPRDRLLNRMGWAWLRAVRRAGGEPPDGPPPRGTRLEDREPAWSAVRADVGRFAAVRDAVRRAYAEPAPEGWQEDVWQRLDEQRAARQRAIESKAAAESRAATERESQEAESARESSETAAPTEEPVEPPAAEVAGSESPASSGSGAAWRWVAVVAAVAAAAFAVRSLMS